jgi:hypothetical protein
MNSGNQSKFAPALRSFLADAGLSIDAVAAATLSSPTDLYELLTGRRAPAPADLNRLFDLRELRAAPDWRRRLVIAFLEEVYPRSWTELIDAHARSAPCS